MGNCYHALKAKGGPGRRWRSERKGGLDEGNERRTGAGPPGPKAHLALVEKWKDVPEGTAVIVTKEDGSEFHTKTRSIPWMLGSSSQHPGHTAVIWSKESAAATGSGGSVKRRSRSARNRTSTRRSRSTTSSSQKVDSQCLSR